MKRFDDKVVYITGGAGGIGRATALQFASEGASLFLTDVNEAGLQETKKLCTEKGAKVAYQICDVSNEVQVDEAVQACVDHFGKLNVLCNNAGILMIQHLKDSTVEHFHRIININLLGTWLHCRAAMPHLIESSGNIVNISSTAAISGQAYQSIYCASKGGISALTRSLQVEFGGQGVRCNAILPGSIGTEMMRPNLPEGIDIGLLDRRRGLRKTATAEELARVVVMIASDEASYIYGQDILADGGMLV